MRVFGGVRRIEIVSGPTGGERKRERVSSHSSMCNNFFFLSSFFFSKSSFRLLEMLFN